MSLSLSQGNVAAGRRTLNVSDVSEPVKTPYVRRWKKTSQYEYGWIVRFIGDPMTNAVHARVGLARNYALAERWLKEQQDGN